MNDIQSKFKDLVNFKQNLSVPRHRWFNIKEGFSKSLIIELINEFYSNENDYILDPFLGSGTTTLTSSEIGLKSIGIEQNPFLFFLAKIKCSNFDNLGDLDFHLNKFKFRNKNDKDKIPDLSISKKLFGEQIHEVLNISKWIESLKNEDVKNIFKIAFLCSLDECSFAKKDGNGLRYPKNRIPKKFTNFFINKLTEIRQDIFFNEKLKSLPKIYNDSCLNINNINGFVKNYENKIGLTIFSPPYANCFDYSEVYKTELWFGRFVNSYEDIKKLRSKSLSSHLNKNIENLNPIPEISNYLKKINIEKLWSKKIPSMLISYFIEMDNLLTNIYNFSKKGSHCVIIIGNSSYSNIVIPTDIIFEEIGKRIGFRKTNIIVARKLSTSSQQLNKVDRPDLLRESLVILNK